MATRVTVRVFTWAPIVNTWMMDMSTTSGQRHLFKGRTSEGRRTLRGEIQKAGAGVEGAPCQLHNPGRVIGLF